MSCHADAACGQGPHLDRCQQLFQVKLADDRWQGRLFLEAQVAVQLLAPERGKHLLEGSRGEHGPAAALAAAADAASVAGCDSLAALLLLKAGDLRAATVTDAATYGLVFAVVAE
jgi:hypothetical protein